MGKKIGVIIQYIIFLGVGIFLIWWQFSKMTPEEVVKFKLSISTADYSVLIPIILMALASHLSRSIRWKIMMAPMGYKPSLFNTFGVTMVGYLANTFVPRLGEILKCTLLGKYEKIPVQKLIGTVVIERVFDFVCYLIFILFTFLIQYKLVGNFIEEIIAPIMNNNTGRPLWLRALLTTIIIVTIILLLRVILKKYASGKFVIRLRNFLAGLKEGISSIIKLKKRGWFLFHTLFIWSMYLAQVYVGFSAMPDISHLGFNAACSVLTLASLANIITPGGIGTFPTAIFLVLSLYKIDQSTGEAFGWLMWGASTSIILFFGLLCLGLLYFINRKKQREELLSKPISIS